MNIGNLELSRRLTTVRRDWGHVRGAPMGEADQSWLRISVPMTLPPDRNSVPEPWVESSPELSISRVVSWRSVTVPDSICNLLMSPQKRRAGGSTREDGSCWVHGCWAWS